MLLANNRPQRRQHHSLTYYLRQTAALLFGAMLAIEYFRVSEITHTFSFWCLALHFVFFQLPLRSRALVWFHPLSYIVAVAEPVRYLILLYTKPGLERDRMELWELSLASVVARALVLHLAPLLFHSLHVALAAVGTGSSTHSLVAGYSSKPRKLILGWSLLCFPLFGWIFDLACPSADAASDTLALERLAPDYEGVARLASGAAAAFAWFLLYFLILRRQHA